MLAVRRRCPPDRPSWSAMLYCFLFCAGPAPTEFSTLSLHDALPILVNVLAARQSADVPNAKAGRSLNAVSPFTTGPLSRDRKSTRLNSSHVKISYAVFCLKKKNTLDRLR